MATPFQPLRERADSGGDDGGVDDGRRALTDVASARVPTGHASPRHGDTHRDWSWTPRRKVGAALLLLTVFAGVIVGIVMVIGAHHGAGGGDALPWWTTAHVYQIYPRSFLSSPGATVDGVGDLSGIRSKLGYLQDLGVDTLWLNPIYPSPMADFGYDVSNYEAVLAMFGTMADLDGLVADAHQRGMHVLLDFVPNHSSDEHPWFLESRASKTSAKRDWYIWNECEGGEPPNNWLSWFGGSMWTVDNATDECYMHQFLPQQPDLNYRNPEVVAAMHDVVRFWLDKGVDGLRVDALFTLFESEALTNEPPNPAYKPSDPPFNSLLHTMTQNVPPIHEAVRGFRSVADEYDGDRVLVCELWGSLDEIMRYYGADGRLDECGLPFNFALIYATGALGESAVWNATVLRTHIVDYLAKVPVGGWPNFVLGNHDNQRVASRMGQQYARAANMMLVMLPGTLTTYYGEEIGMHDVFVPWNEVKDPNALRQGKKYMNITDRDVERTPMQWDESQHAGFMPGAPAGAKPWLPVASDFASRNVAVQARDPHSDLSLFKALTSLRRSSQALLAGSYFAVDVQGGAGAANVLAWARCGAPPLRMTSLQLDARVADARDFVVLINYAETAATVTIGATASSVLQAPRASAATLASGGTLLVSTTDVTTRAGSRVTLHGTGAAVELAPTEGVVIATVCTPMV